MKNFVKQVSKKLSRWRCMPIRTWLIQLNDEYTIFYMRQSATKVLIA